MGLTVQFMTSLGLGSSVYGNIQRFNFLPLPPVWHEPSIMSINITLCLTPVVMKSQGMISAVSFGRYVRKKNQGWSPFDSKMNTLSGGMATAMSVLLPSNNFCIL
jgi:hypothetical protein